MLHFNLFGGRRRKPSSYEVTTRPPAPGVEGTHRFEVTRLRTDPRRVTFHADAIIALQGQIRWDPAIVIISDPCSRILHYNTSMDTNTAQQLIDMNTRFYAQAAPSFSASRHNSWPGWERFVEELDAKSPDGEALAVADLASGNLRFEVYLERALPQHTLTFYTADNCNAFALEQVESALNHQSIDLIEHLMRGSLARELNMPPCDAVVCFGFLHHIPSTELRTNFLKEALQLVKPKGLLCVSFWRFAEEASMLEKAQATTKEAAEKLGFATLEEGDYLLGWQNEPNIYRYCHSFSDKDIRELTESVQDMAQLVASYDSDGRNGRMNSYLIFQRR